MTQYRYSDYYHVKEILGMYRADDDQERSVMIIENGVGGSINHILETGNGNFLFGSGPMLDSGDTENEALFQIVIDQNGNLVGKKYRDHPFLRSQQNMIRRLLRNPSIAHFIGQRLLINTGLDFYNFEPYVEPEDNVDEA